MEVQADPTFCSRTARMKGGVTDNTDLRRQGRRHEWDHKRLEVEAPLDAISWRI